MKLSSILLLSIASTETSAFIVSDRTRQSGNQRISLPVSSSSIQWSTPTKPSPRIVMSASSDESGETTSAETTELADSIFDSIDVNDDGGISNDELRSHLQEAGYSTESIRYLFTALDKNADGVISREEMRYAFSTYEVSALYNAFGICDIFQNQEINQVKYDQAVNEIRSSANIDDKTKPEMFAQLADVIFGKIDADNNGSIDREELREFFRDTESSTTFRDVGNATNVSVETIFSALDVNSDGSITKEEMRNGFQQFDHRALSKAFGFVVARRSEV